MDFHKIEFEDDPTEMAEEDLRELVAKFQKAQEANVEQFEEVSERVDDFEEYDDELTEELVEASPLSEAEVDNVSFTRKRDLLAEFTSEEEVESEGGEEGGEGEGPEEFGQQGPTHDGEDESGTPEFIKEAYDGMAGVDY